MLSGSHGWWWSLTYVISVTSLAMIFDICYQFRMSGDDLWHMLSVSHVWWLSLACVISVTHLVMISDMCCQCRMCGDDLWHINHKVLWLLISTLVCCFCNKDPTLVASHKCHQMCHQVSSESDKFNFLLILFVFICNQTARRTIRKNINSIHKNISNRLCNWLFLTFHLSFYFCVSLKSTLYANHWPTEILFLSNIL